MAGSSAHTPSAELDLSAEAEADLEADLDVGSTGTEGGFGFVGGGQDDKGSSQPLFGRLWSYEELLDVKPEERPDWTPSPPPPHWPALVQRDKIGRRVFWLPEDWEQAIKTTKTGGTLKCFVSPSGKVFFHKKDIEKYLGYLLPTMDMRTEEEKPDKDHKDTPACRDVTKAIPSWPSSLPTDWRICFRRLPSRLHLVYVPPNQEEGFFYQGSQVQSYLRNENVPLNSFGRSRPMAMRRVDAASSAADRTKRRKKNSFAAEPLRLPAVQPQPPLATAEDAAVVVSELRHLLRLRFGSEPPLPAIVGAPRSSKEQLDRICGVYYQLPALVQGRFCYQKLLRLVHSDSQIDVGCDGVYIMWDGSRWCVSTAPAVGSCAFAYCLDSHQSLAEVSAVWQVCGDAMGEAFAPEPSVRVVFCSVGDEGQKLLARAGGRGGEDGPREH